LDCLFVSDASCACNLAIVSFASFNFSSALILNCCSSSNCFFKIPISPPKGGNAEVEAAEVIGVLICGFGGTSGFAVEFVEDDDEDGEATIEVVAETALVVGRLEGFVVVVVVDVVVVDVVDVVDVAGV